MSGEHIRNEYGSSRCTSKEMRFPKIKILSSNWPELANGASRGNPGKSGVAMVFRDAAGDFFALLPVQTNMYSEIMAIQLAAEICVHKGFTNVTIETDSTIARLIMIQD
ncbi:hypothetical protein CQW23_20024 [Capsicum baccatum]|uniref:RNase H type-1 domain-containing protein n=1 Tax=Capsicum baccatum TaxID=33114 RepID=A0A2G2W7F6_CAPBA|nr:hypothetical protein CQW23_20024 [Capsicum baccatum]